MKYPNLLKPFEIGSQKFSNRVLMAPLTRCRAGLEHIPNELMATYYSQRASSGLLIAEATMIQEGNSAFIAEPGIYSNAQIQGWKKVTNAVHDKGGKIYLQIWHGGRACHPNLNNGHETVSCSAIAIDGEINTLQGKVRHVVPREIKEQEIPTYIGYYKGAAENAKLAGFDGVEVHAANGYLIDQFLRDGSNKRQGKYGGSIENRTRFLIEVVREVISVWGAERVGVRISPLNSYNDMKDSNPLELTRYISRELSALKVGYLHVMRGDFFGVQKADILPVARENYTGTLIANMGYGLEEAEATLVKGLANAVAFGNFFISNPDLVERIKLDRPLATPIQSTFYTPGEKGYTDYPGLISI